MVAICLILFIVFTMIRQYRIERFNGLEVLVCEIYRKHTLTQSEYAAFQSWKDEEEKHCVGASKVLSIVDFKEAFREWLLENHADNETFYGLNFEIPVYDYLPSIILRGVIVDNRIASLQVDYDRATLSPEVVDAVNKFYGVLDSLHWRDMVAHQIEKYGSLFDSDND